MPGRDANQNILTPLINVSIKNHNKLTNNLLLVL